MTTQDQQTLTQLLIALLGAVVFALNKWNNDKGQKGRDAIRDDIGEIKKLMQPVKTVQARHGKRLDDHERRIVTLEGPTDGKG